MTAYLRQARVALILLALLTVILGGIYPVAVFALGQGIAPAQANGSVVKADGAPAASSLIAQQVPEKDSRFFFPRPSAVKWDPASSGASNLGPSDPALASGVAKTRAAVAAREGVPESAVPEDAVSASASGLDPDISPAYAALQAPRVAKAARLSLADVQQLIREATTTGVESALGQESVNTTTLNLAIGARLGGSSGTGR
ncbi:MULTISPECIES: K(+)-transporting ATPase subunit C [Arthrobacter]|uniref:Potassium-transporting ATPase KdpC subunit n=2 Tax=Arthrobacter TaxID=1663 RepID=A0ABU9KKR6_9MICC|nr:K(+)-transporting ATPase subunit C [Arthrobacter sp. YJM1]MDP5227501.1 K(+)-transporting ATPase subunit C [Arthrobacter sp. YJM1]